MPVLVLLLVAFAVGTLVTAAAWWYPTPATAPTMSVAAGHTVGQEIAHHSRLRRALRRRLDPQVGTGLALTIALGVVILGGIGLAFLTYLVRSDSRLLEIDASVAQWGADHAGPTTERILEAMTQLGETWLAVVLLIVVGIVGYLRRPSRWIPVFLLTVFVGQWLLTNSIKELLDRVRPDLNPLAATLGPSFPSGHTTTAAAMWAAFALVLARGSRSRSRALLAGGAAAIAVAVACTRVFLDVHWLTDVLAGLFLGWAWFALCSIAFGGRILRFGAPAEEVMHELERRPVAAKSSG